MIKHVLFVEDETQIAHLYAQVLNVYGYEVDVVSNGVSGLAAAQTGKYDLILLDIMLPGMSGLDILDILKDPVKTPNFNSKIVILTNMGEDDQTHHRILGKSDGYLLKVDYTPKMVVHFIQDIDKSGSAALAPDQPAKPVAEAPDNPPAGGPAPEPPADPVHEQPAAPQP